MVPFKLKVLLVVILIGVLVQNSSSKSVDERNNAESPADLEQLEDTEKEHQLVGSKRNVNLEGDLALIERAVNNTGLTKDEIEEVEKRGWRRFRRRRRRRRSRRRRYRRRRFRRRRYRRRYRRRRYRRRRSRRRSGRRGSRRRGSGQNGGSGGFGSHIGSAISGGLDAVNTGLDLAHNLSPGNRPENADEDINEEEDTF